MKNNEKAVYCQVDDDYQDLDITIPPSDKEEDSLFYLMQQQHKQLMFLKQYMCHSGQ